MWALDGIDVNRLNPKTIRSSSTIEVAVVKAPAHTILQATLTPGLPWLNMSY